MFCESFFRIYVDNNYNTILPYFYLYYFNEYVGANLKGNIKNWAYGYIDWRRKKGPLSKNDFTLTVNFQRMLALKIDQYR